MSYVIKRPLITEKNSLLAEKNIHVFEVSRTASKTDIKNHVEKYFKVTVRSIKTCMARRDGRKTRSRRGTVIRFKKAFVRLKDGERIQIFEGN